MKTVVGLMLAACVCHVAVVAFPLADPGRLLRVPRIYNALIRSDAKLQPSRASPYSSPVFQPIGLGPEPGYDQWQPPPPPYALTSGADEPRTQTTAPKQSDDNDKSKLKSDNTKMAAPLTFYPRSFGYYQPQQILPYGYPFGPHPYLFGSPYEFGQHQPFFRYPTPSFDGYFGGLYTPGVEQFHNSYHPQNNMEPEQTRKKPDEAEEKEIDIKSSSDSVGVRESEFLVDEQEAEDASEVADLKKGSHEAEATS